MLVEILLCLSLCIMFSLCQTRSFDYKLRYFETLSTNDIVSWRRRSASGTRAEVSFRAFGRRFDLLLIHGSPVLSKGFQAKTVDKYGRETPFSVNHEDFFTGHLAGDDSVSVSGHYEDGLLCASVRFPREIYVVEPAWRHLPSSADTAMLVYRASDVILNHSFPLDDPAGGLGLVLPTGAFPRSEGIFASRNTSFTSTRREKRSTGEKKICQVVALADFEFYKDICRSSKYDAVKHITTVMYNVDRNLKRTEWEEGLVGYGIHLAGVLVHTEYSKTRGHYNSKSRWKPFAKLLAFLQHASQIKDYCLGHLYTGTSFPSGINGMSTVAKKDRTNFNGICGRAVLYKGTKHYLNGGFSSGKTSSGRPVTAVQAELVSTHEVAHGWGAKHDPATPECAPASADGGRYVMWSKAKSGQDKNNLYFSPCSKRAVAPVIRAKAHLCFVDDPVGTSSTQAPDGDTTQGLNTTEDPELTGDPKTLKSPSNSGVPQSTKIPKSVEGRNPLEDRASSEAPKSTAHPDSSVGAVSECGNTVLEKGEECDAGTSGDRCCTPDCKLIGGAKCSDISSLCCRECQVAPQGTECSKPPFDSCKAKVHCNGTSWNCPEPQSVADNTPCTFGGQCHNGTCLSFCHIQGQQLGRPLLPCVCVQDKTAACRVCCQQDSPGAACEATDQVLEDDSPCDLGRCRNGSCQVIELSDVLQSVTSETGASTVVAFIRDNVVFTVILLLFLIAFPAWIRISRQDRQGRRTRASARIRKHSDVEGRDPDMCLTNIQHNSSEP